MALSQYRVKFSVPHAAYNGGEVGFFTPIVAQALSDASVGTVLDAVPANTAKVAKSSARHMARDAASREAVASEGDRQLLAAQVAAL